MKNLILFIAAGIVIIIAVAGLFAYSAKDVEIVSADISTIKDLSFTGVTIEGEIEVHNGGFLPVIVDMITYSVVMEDIEGVVGEGNITGKTVMPGENEMFPVVIRLEWVPSLETALELITSNSTYAEVAGIVHIAELKGFIKLELPFTARVNLQGYVEQFMPTLPSVIPDGITSDIIEGVGDVIDIVSDNAGDIIGAIEGLVS